MKIWQFETFLKDVEPFRRPKIKLEQYCTGAHIAAHMLTAAQDQYGDIEGKTVLDLGCGTGMLTAAAVMKGADLVVGVDVDEDAIEQARENAEKVETNEESKFVNMDIEDFGKFIMKKRKEEAEGGQETKDEEKPQEEDKEKDDSDDESSDEESDDDEEDLASIPSHFDTVITNPPFGTKLEHADVKFLLAAIALSDHVVYSLHKTSTIDYILGRAKKMGCQAEAIAQLNFDLPKSYKFHKEENRVVDVTLVRIVKKKGDEEKAEPEPQEGYSDEDSDDE
uniref:Methyltransferase domain-containing protein n=1 Tax=Percolomonas cosmopolitus TaxID=63605 RepID=A0A7S1KTT1_9EUKA|eukprot:CAMPEP_0117448670 /NCGR_PEP_ID=MMETSP0759-20121206/7527_1 /TAXON_ID=63605 /ORGANISM="Percolomonas cosmopolitus, Strain WS" /LENGTH=279 /DNA_ID=CAMNT_0005241077 /DNA_START=31 /DNA_END=870 /DNA_ORIENTATION=+